MRPARPVRFATQRRAILRLPKGDRGSAQRRGEGEATVRTSFLNLESSLANCGIYSPVIHTLRQGQKATAQFAWPATWLTGNGNARRRRRRSPDRDADAPWPAAAPSDRWQGAGSSPRREADAPWLPAGRAASAATDVPSCTKTAEAR